jgi:Domain of unknown function (DUF4407)
LGRVLIWLSGASRQVLDECPTDRGRYVGIGTAILVTAVMAGVSLAFALVTALRVPFRFALPFAIAWGIAILCLDRLFVVSLPRSGTRRAHLLRATPRVLLALLLGFVISTPFVLQIFRPEIEHEITVLQAQAEQSYLKSQAAGQLQGNINADVATVNKLSTEAGGGGQPPTPPQDAQINILNTELNQADGQESRAQAQENADSTTWSCQAYGHATNSNCSGFTNVGQGPLADAAENAYHAARAEFQRAASDAATLSGEIGPLRTQASQYVASTEASVKAEAQSRLPGAKAALASAQQAQAAETAKFTAQNDNDSGLLIRMQALDALTSGNLTLEAARWLLFALFVVIDVMPVMIKVMLNMGPESNYDRMLAAEEKKQLRVAASNRAVRQAAETLSAETVLGEAQSRLDGWRTPIPEVTQNIVAARTRVEARRIRAWENRQAMRPLSANGGGPGALAPDTDAPVGFITWPQASGSAGYQGARPTAVLRNLGLRSRHMAAARWHGLRFRRSSPRAGQAPGSRAYGAPWSPGIAHSINGNGRAGSGNPH